MGYLTPDTLPTGKRRRVLLIPDDTEYMQIVSGLLLELTEARKFDEFGSATPDEVALLFSEMFEDFFNGVGMVGEVFMWIGANPPVGALFCDGTQYNRVDYPALYSALDSAFKPDADHFVTPDLRGRTPIGAGTGSGLTARNVGDSGGAEVHQLTEAQMPIHTHAVSTFMEIAVPAPGEVVASLELPFNLGQTQPAGGNQAHNNIQPFTVLKFCVWAK